MFPIVPFLLAAVLVVAAPFRPAAADAASPRVVTSLLPVHALAQGVLGPDADVHLLVPPGRSPHGFALKPSDMRALSRADAVFWVSRGLETFLPPALRTTPGTAAVVELAAVPGVRRLPARTLGAWGGGDHDHGHDHDGHDHGGAEDGDGDHDGHDGHGHDLTGYDPHLWLDPRNARAWVAAIADTVAARAPDQAAAVRRRADDLTRRLDALEREMADTLAPVRDVPFFVFHDAYQYLEARFGLSPVGAVALDPSLPAGVRHIADLRDRVAQTGAACLFVEPQFNPDLGRTVAEGTGMRVASLDPLGLDVGSGPEAYFQVMRGIARDIRDCLSGARAEN